MIDWPTASIILGLGLPSIALVWKILDSRSTGKKPSNGNGSKPVLGNDEHDWLRTLHELHSAKNEDGLPIWYFPSIVRKQMEHIEELSEEILKLSEFNERTLKDIWTTIVKDKD